MLSVQSEVSSTAQHTVSISTEISISSLLSTRAMHVCLRCVSSVALLSLPPGIPPFVLIFITLEPKLFSPLVCRLPFALFFQTLFCESPIPGRETFSLNARLTNYLPWRYFCVTKSWKIRNAYKYLHLHNFRIFFFKWKFIVLNVKFEMA